MIQDAPVQTCRGFVVSGVVQGVGFRAATQGAARQIGLTGWVRNRSDGCVEGVAYGDVVRLDRFVEWLNQGPPSARVESVWHSDAMEDETITPGFEVR